MDGLFFGVMTFGVAIGIAIGATIAMRPTPWRCPSCGRGR